ncbi:MAG: hypothetical protein NTY46_13655, partial [Candidatus Sumerlaeota bacterium]|nr:hypothetical protein [Candidatus Sumerlaeota bacterium]
TFCRHRPGCVATLTARLCVAEFPPTFITQLFQQFPCILIVGDPLTYAILQLARHGLHPGLSPAGLANIARFMFGFLGLALAGCFAAGACHLDQTAMHESFPIADKLT